MYGKKLILTLTLHHIQNNVEMSHRPKYKTKTINLLEETIGESLCNFDFLVET